MLPWWKRLFNLSPAVYLAVLLVIVLFVTALATKCHAATGYVQVSGGSTVVRGAAPIIALDFAYPSGFEPGDFWKGGLIMVGSSTFKGADAPNNYILHAAYSAGFGHFDIAIGISWMQNYLPYNGGAVNANLEAAYRFERWPVTVTYDHFSDAGTKLPNYGRDMVMAGWRF